MAEVVLPLRRATERLPSICAMTGERADGAISLRTGRSLKRWNSPVVKVPLSEPVFRRWSQRQNIHIKARGFASVLAAVAIVVAFRNGALGISILLAALAVHLVDLWADRTAKQSRPELEREGSDLRISGVHAAFAKAVAEMP